jgi:ankyrin repeat protein
VNSFTTDDLVRAIRQEPSGLSRQKVLQIWAKGRKIAKKDFLKDDTNGDTPLYWASREGQLGVVHALLLSNDEKLNWGDFIRPNAHGKTALAGAAEGHQLHRVHGIVSENGEKLTKQHFLKPSTNGAFPGAFPLGLFIDDLDKVQAIVKKNGERLSKEDFLRTASRGNTGLSNVMGSLSRWQSIIQILQENGERLTKHDFLQQNSDGISPLFRAAGSKEYLRMIRSILKEYGEPLRSEDYLTPSRTNRSTPLYQASVSNTLAEIFIAEDFIGRIPEMEELWNAVPANTKGQIDYPAICQRVMELSVQRVRPGLGLEHGVQPGDARQGNAPDQSKEGKS